MNIIVSGGGTGGHIYPAISLIEELKKRDENNKILYVGTEKGLESNIVPKLGMLEEFLEKSMRIHLKL